ncbi:MAG: HgcAB-like fusion protein [Candidatus Ranarchaeia archaeon]
MKILETSPSRYDRGIQLLTLGMDYRIKRFIADNIILKNDQVLDVGAGTGELAVLCAKKGAHVTAFDSSSRMLNVAKKKVKKQELAANVRFLEMDVTEMGQFPDSSFDVVVMTLLLSDLQRELQIFVLKNARRLLREGGRLVIADEVQPENWAKRLLFNLIRLPLSFLTYLVAQTTTHAVSGLSIKIREIGFHISQQHSFLMGSLNLIIAEKRGGEAGENISRGLVVTRLGSKLKFIAETVFRWVSFPIPPGCLIVGHPGPESPVFVTCNFDLSVRRLFKSLKKDGIDCYVLVAPTRGINVWCAACGGDFTSHSVISVIRLSHISDFVSHRLLILPQLSAPGVDPAVIKDETGWTAKFGPVDVKDISNYLRSEFQKSTEMRMVKFPLSKRLEMALVYALTISLVIGGVSLIFAPTEIFKVLATIWLITGGAYAFFPYLPGATGYVKELIYSFAAIALILTVAFILTNNIFGFPIILAVSIVTLLFVGVDFAGTTPVMPSDLGQIYYRKGHDKMPFLTGSYPLQPYGRITQDLSRCISCGTCIDVCPRNVYERIGEQVTLKRSSSCICCNACIHRCPKQCLYFT